MRRVVAAWRRGARPDWRNRPARRRTGAPVRRAVVSAGLLLTLVAALAAGADSGRAASACVLEAQRAEASSVHATRAVFIVSGKSNSHPLHITTEYSEDGSQWQGGGTATEELNTSQGEVGEYGKEFEVQHLKADTRYFGRAIVENGCTTVLKTFEFRTTAVGAPEVTKLDQNQIEGASGVALGLEYADYEARIQSDGATTKYRFEVRKQGESGWAPASGSGTSGIVTLEEDFVEAKAHMTGLTPETSYELRVVAENEPNPGEVKRGEASAQFPTAFHHPEASLEYISGASATSGHAVGGVVAHSVETHWRFEYATAESGPWSIGPEGTISTAEAGEGPHQAPGELSGLTEHTTYYVRLHADNGHEPAATSRVVSFETGGRPLASTFAVHAFAPGSETIRLLGSVQPNGYDTHYHFQYVSQEELAESGWANSAATPETDLGPGEFQNGFSVSIVGQDAPALQAGKTYHYRIVAVSSQGSATGDDATVSVPTPGPGEEPVCPNQTLRTGPSGGLPDCRAYEQVTPAEKGATADNWVYSGNHLEPVAVGEDGNHVFVRPQLSKWGTSGDASNASYFFTRESGGWQMTSATPQPHAGGNSYHPDLFSPDLTDTAIDVGWGTSVTIVSSQVEFMLGAPGGPYSLVASIPRTQLRGTGDGWAAASADFGKAILQTEDHTLLGHATGTSSGDDLYEYFGGALHQLNVGIGTCGAAMAKANAGGAPGGAMSADGSRVFFEAVPGSVCSEPSHLYMRVGGTETVDLGAYRLLAADAQRSRLLVERHSGETYEYLLYDVASKTARMLISAHESLQLKASRELSAIYFTTVQRLTPDTPRLSPQSEEAGVAPQELYRYDLAEGRLQFVLQASTDGPAGVSPDGRYLYFEAGGVAAVFSETEKQYTLENKGFVIENQVYRYDSAEGVVQCMSCASSFNPRPQLAAIFAEHQEDTPDLVPSETAASENGDYVFFDTPSALVPQDRDGELIAGTHNALTEEHDFSYSPSSDVYEWRRNGVGGCPHVQGCLALISSGTGGLKNILLGATSSGRDVFFATHSRLVGQDTDNQGDVYDARIGGGFPPPPAPPTECQGDACQSPLAAPIDTTPASLAFSGTGNSIAPPPLARPVAAHKAKPTRCRRGTVRKQGRCVQAKRRPRRVLSHPRGRR